MGAKGSSTSRPALPSPVAGLKEDIAEAQRLAADPGTSTNGRAVLAAYADGITHALHALGYIR